MRTKTAPAKAVRTTSRKAHQVHADYTDDEVEFIKAMDQYKRDQKRPFPTWQEVLSVLTALGYRKGMQHDAA
jgi:hypothetical protein